MFIRVKTSPNSPRKSIQVVKSYRDKQTGKCRQQILHHIGTASNAEEESKLQKIGLEVIAKIKSDEEKQSPQLSLFAPLSPQEHYDAMISKSQLGRKPKKDLKDVIPINQVTLDLVYEESRVVDGVHEVGGYVYDSIGYNNILENKKYKSILKDLVLSRISDPCSKLATNKMLKRYYMKDHDLDSIYRTMDKLFENIDGVLKNTFEATVKLIPGKVEIVLFDVTTLHFESTEVDQLRKFGYSKNFRFNTTQVVLALATNTDGLPIGYELFAGNRAEVSTLIKSIESWKEKFEITNVCFIGDRAMFSEDNLKQLDDRNYQYIVAAKLRSLPSVMQDKIFNESNYKVSTVDNDVMWVGQFKYEENDLAKLIEQQSKSNQIKKYSEIIEKNKNRSFIVSYSSNRARHDSKQREILLGKVEKQLGKSKDGKKLITNSALKKYTTSIGKSEAYIDNDKIDREAQLDGFHGVITNIQTNKNTLFDLGKEETKNFTHILSKYRKLVKIEDCFRVNKTTLKMRPIYHFKPERIRAHIAICYMSFAIVRQIEYRTRIIKKLSVPSIIEELNSVQSSIYVHKETKDRYKIPGSFSNDARKIYQAIGVNRVLDAHPLVLK